MSRDAIRTAAVVGDGIAGWTAAAALARRLPGVRVGVVPVADLPPGLADLVATTPPSSRDFHADLGLEDRDIVARTQGAWRLGTRVVGNGRDYVHAYGPVGMAIDGLPFATAWSIAGEGTRFEDFSPGAVLGRAGKLPGDDPMLATVGVGMTLHPGAYRAFVGAYARHCGVRVTVAPLVEVVVTDERVTALRLGDGSSLTADLYVDATNAARRVIGALPGGGEWQDWTAFLPCTRLTRATAPPLPVLPTLDQATATTGGWHVVMALPGRTDHIFAGDHAAASGPSVRIAAGRLARAWIGNVAAVGDAHAVVGILDAAPLQLLHAQVDRLIRALPGRDFAAVELADINREAAAEADRLRDFQVMHDADAPAIPPDLADTFARFDARGRWRQRDGDLLDRDDCHMLLFGLRPRPRSIDAIARRADRGQIAAGMRDFRHRLAAAAAAAAAAPAPIR